MIIGKIQKGEKAHIQVSTENYQGYDYVDIRMYFMNEDGEIKPTKKGVTLRPEQINELIELLQEAKKNL